MDGSLNRYSGIRVFRCSGVQEGPSHQDFRLEYLKTRIPEHLNSFRRIAAPFPTGRSAQSINPLMVTIETGSRLQGLLEALEHRRQYSETGLRGRGPNARPNRYPLAPPMAHTTLRSYGRVRPIAREQWT